MIQRTIHFTGSEVTKTYRNGYLWIRENGGTFIMSSEGAILDIIRDKRQGGVKKAFIKQHERHMEQEPPVFLEVADVKLGCSLKSPNIVVCNPSASLLAKLESDLNGYDNNGRFKRLDICIQSFSGIKDWASYYLPEATGNVPDKWDAFIEEHSEEANVAYNTLERT